MVEITVINNGLNPSLGTEIKVNQINSNVRGIEIKRELEKIEVDNYDKTSN